VIEYLLPKMYTPLDWTGDRLALGRHPPEGGEPPRIPCPPLESEGSSTCHRAIVPMPPWAR
jgi:hypothetical protein